MFQVIFYDVFQKQIILLSRILIKEKQNVIIIKLILFTESKKFRYLNIYFLFLSQNAAGVIFKQASNKRQIICVFTQEVTKQLGADKLKERTSSFRSSDLNGAIFVANYYAQS